jgi:hypothetical protein
MTVERDDVPAAHSMDTTWYAVDADGAVAEFTSGEAGGVPHRAACTPEMGRLDDFPIEALRIARMAAAGRLPELEELDTPRAERVIVILGLREGGGDGPASYRVSAADSERIETLLAPFEPWEVRAEAPRVLATGKPLDVAKLAALKADAGVRRVIADGDRFDLIEAARESDADPIFRYGNDDYEVPGAYVRRGAPADPIRVDDLPAKLQEPVRAVRFPMRFAEAAELQLADHFDAKDVQTWGDQPLLGGEPEPPGDAPAPGPLPSQPLPQARPGLALAALVGLVLLCLLWLWWRG